MLCDRCEALKRSADTLQQEYENDVLWLSDIEQTVGIEAYKLLKRMSDAARAEYELARAELEQHLATEHKTVD